VGNITDFPAVKEFWKSVFRGTRCIYNRKQTKSTK